MVIKNDTFVTLLYIYPIVGPPGGQTGKHFCHPEIAIPKRSITSTKVWPRGGLTAATFHPNF